MKIILSRKGFDSSNGGKPSPIYDGKFISIPVPEVGSGIFYKDLMFNKTHTFLDVMIDLNITSFTEAHLDPDLRKSILKERPKSWRPSFGTGGMAQKTLEGKKGIKEGIKKGDLFLFFGWFKNVVEKNNHFTYEKSADNIHAIYGYLEVDEIIKVDKNDIPEWLKYHPHVVLKDRYSEKYRKNYDNNTIYVGGKILSFDSNKPGAGCFRYNKRLRLTKEGETRSVWELPGCFEHQKFNGAVTISRSKNNKVTLTVKGRTQQEFYIGDEKGVVTWAKNLLRECRVYQ